MGANKDFKVKNGLTVTQDLSVGGDSYLNALTATTLEALTATFTKTIVSTTSALSVINHGTGPALYVRQTGTEPIAQFFDYEGGEIHFADTGKVGIGTGSPDTLLHVEGVNPEVTIMPTGNSGSSSIQLYRTTGAGAEIETGKIEGMLRPFVSLPLTV